MKKFQPMKILFTIVIVSILSACGTGTQSYYLAPDDSNSIPGQTVTHIDLTMTAVDQYNSCVSLQSVSVDAETDLFSSGDYSWRCGPEVPSGFALMMVPASSLATITPTPVDNVIVYGVVAIEGVFWAILAVATGVVIGGSVVWSKHSNPDHNPNINGSQARTNINAILAAMTAYLAGNGPDPRNKCGVTKDAGGAIIRAAIWVADSTRSAGGYLAWYFINQPGSPMMGPWGGSYDISAENFDMDRRNQADRDKGYTWTTGIDCNSLNIPSFLQAAQR